MTSEAATQPELRRSLGLADAVGIGFGAIVGAGIFVVTGVAAGVAGPAILVALPLAGVAAAANALSSAQLAARYPQAGGTYEYGHQVLHPWAGFAAGWMFLASKTAAAGTVGLGIAAYLERVAPGVPGRVVALLAIAVFTAVNYLGVRKSSAVNLGIVAVSALTLTVFSVVGLTRFDAAHLRPFAPSGAGGVVRAAALLFFAYTGYARVATLGEEVREPRTTIPRAILITVSGVSILYLLVVVAAVGGAGADALAGSGAPLAAAAERMRVPALVPAVSAAAVIAMLGVLLSQLLGLSRMAFAMARRGTCRGRWRRWTGRRTRRGGQCWRWARERLPRRRSGRWTPSRRRPRSPSCCTTRSPTWRRCGCRVGRSCTRTRCRRWDWWRASPWPWRFRRGRWGVGLAVLAAGFAARAAVRGLARSARSV
jgi:APA family basic amino acid/polyamine antiporter